MKKSALCFSILVLCASITAFSQPQAGSVLITIGNEKITKEEFVSVYKKNNAKEGVLDKKSLNEYLDLYTIFRLKVKEAKEMGIDTTKAFKDELAGYRKTLAQPYLSDSATINGMVREAYQRMQWDIRTSHILLKMESEASPEDTLDAFTRISIIRDFINGKGNPANLKKYETMVKTNLKISKASPPKDTMMAFNKLNPLKNMFKLKTHDFASVAKVVSEHASKSKGGDLGYLTGMMGQGYPYEYEHAAYKAKQGEVTAPVRSTLGYHLLFVTDKRAHKELHLAHLMLLFKKGMTKEDSLKLHAKVDSLYQQLKGGANFEEMVQKMSDHKETAKKGGDIGWISLVSNFPREFKEAAFNIKDNGQLSEPVKTAYGWHIIKRLGIRDLPAFDSLKTEIKSRVQKDERNNVAKEIFITKIKKQYNFKEMPKCISDFYAIVDSTLPRGQWKAEKAASLSKPMFTILDKTYTQQDFAKYLEKNYRMGGNNIPKRIVDVLYKPFVDESCLNMRESRLEAEHPDFKMLMTEYNDGILLFNLTDQKVWSKAIKDTTGAKGFYEKNQEHFMWDERLDASIYTCSNEKVAEKIRKLIKQNKSDKEILASLNKDTVVNVSIDNKITFLKGDNAMLDETGWVPGVTANKTIKNKIVFANIRKVLKPTPKSFAEARGLVASEYQTWLEKDWIESLKKKYPVSVDRKVFDSIQ